MNCSIIRDLLPLYGVNGCRKETEEMVSKHLENCQQCSELYKTMQDELGLKNSAGAFEGCVNDNDFWSRYYARLLIGGYTIFFFIYGILVAINCK